MQDCMKKVYDSTHTCHIKNKWVVCNIFSTGGMVGTPPPLAKFLFIATYLEKCPHSRLLPQNFYPLAPKGQSPQLNNNFLYHFYFTFIPFIQTGHVN